MIARVFVTIAGAASCLSAPTLAQRLDINPEASLEARIFAEDPQFADQFETFQGSLIVSGEASWRSKDRDTRILFEPYIRLDSEDGERTYVDIREASFSREINRDWDVLVGVSQVFWGVAESRNVVDVINQFDTVEDADEGEKLGQPMIRVTRRGDFGTLEAYYLPFFRERQFPGQAGRLRTAPRVEADAASYERGGEQTAGDFALRYTNRFGGFDLGGHVFYGTSRNPRLDFNPSSGLLEPFYPELTQGGVDLQWTKEAWLLKGEIVVGEMQDDTFTSAVGGFEYTVFDIGGQGWDVGLIGEYLYDDRDQTRLPVTLFENDVFVGTRITLNDIQDTEFLAGAIIDDQTGSAIASAEVQRRLGDTLLLEVEARLFTAENDDPFVSALNVDDNLLIRLTRYF
ncbi:MAG: hypothetical protein AAGL90_15230 [Pseudomonadota bacterium]